MPSGSNPRLARDGLLLINLGSPDAPEPAAVRRYLKQFLSDRRVVEIPPVAWQPILRLAVLPTRPKRSAAAYRRVWAQDSPLRMITAEQTAAMASAFPDLRVDYAMRYGNPSMESRVRAMCEAGVERLFVAPLYPQYSSATTGTVLEELFRILSGLRAVPAVSTLPPYYSHPAYIGALAQSLSAALAGLDFQPERILLSFHGMPARVTALGDPYQRQCAETARLLRLATGHDERSMPLVYQSRFGRAEWLQPYTEPTLIEMARQGVRRVAVMTPGFSADCLETLEEIGNEAAHAFRAAGGSDFAAIPCLNASSCGIELLRSIIGETLGRQETAV